jgi:CubicO group peptidase (beta-lactamase class C family)
MKRTTFILFALWLLCITSLAGASDDQSEHEPLTAKVDKLFAEWDNWDSPGAALAIIKDGTVVYKRGYGSANLEYNIAITPATIFNVGSVSKQFTAFAIAMLAEQSKLSLDDDIRKYLPEVPDFGKTITIRHLIHHTSGLRDYLTLLAMAGWRLDDVITKEHILKMVSHQKELNFDPGEEHLYCNTGYTLLAEIVARVSGQSFREYTEANIFKPLGMANTHFYDDYEMVVKDSAYSYKTKEDGGFKKSVLSCAIVGDGNLFTTVEDLMKWIQNFDDGRVGGLAVIEQMYQRGVLNNGKELDYAFGLIISTHKGLRTVWHNGADAGYRSNILWFPDQRFGVAVLSNLGTFNPVKLANQVADIYLADHLTPEEPEAERTEVEVDPAIYDAYVGKYQSEGGTLITITKEDDRLMENRTGRPKDQLFPESETRFFVKGADVQVSFQRDETGEVTQLTVHQGGPDMPAKRIQAVSPAPEELAEFVGDYYSDELGAIYTMIVQDGKLVAQHRRHNDIPLTPTVADEFSGGTWWFLGVRFSRDEHRKVTGFRLTGWGVRNVRFDKWTR